MKNNLNSLYEKLKIYEKNLMFELSDDERWKTAKEFFEILSMFDKFRKIDLTNIDSTNHCISLNQELRSDEIRRKNDSDKLLECSKNYNGKFVEIKNEK